METQGIAQYLELFSLLSKSLHPASLPDFLMRSWMKHTAGHAWFFRAAMLKFYDLCALIPFLAALGREPAIVETFRAIQDMDRRWRG